MQKTIPFLCTVLSKPQMHMGNYMHQHLSMFSMPVLTCHNECGYFTDYHNITDSLPTLNRGLVHTLTDSAYGDFRIIASILVHQGDVCITSYVPVNRISNSMGTLESGGVVWHLLIHDRLDYRVCTQCNKLGCELKEYVSPHYVTIIQNKFTHGIIQYVCILYTYI